MNRNILVALIVICFFSALTACHKSKSAPNNGTMRATYNGKDGTDTFVATQVTVNLSAGGYLTIDGKEKDRHIFMSVYDFNKQNGTFILGGTISPSYFAEYDTMRFVADTGLLVLTTTGPNSASGSFHFHCTDSTVITNGTLFINY